jgi:hypothetical protein
MRNNTGVVLFDHKAIVFRFEEVLYSVDLTDGDLEDSWSSITNRDGQPYDTNFYLESPKNSPTFYLYKCKDKGDGNWEVDTTHETEIKIVKQIGKKSEYLKH